MGIKFYSTNLWIQHKIVIPLQTTPATFTFMRLKRFKVQYWKAFFHLDARQGNPVSTRPSCDHQGAISKLRNKPNFLSENSSHPPRWGRVCVRPRAQAVGQVCGKLQVSQNTLYSAVWYLAKWFISSNGMFEGSGTYSYNDGTRWSKGWGSEKN